MHDMASKHSAHSAHSYDITRYTQDMDGQDGLFFLCQPNELLKITNHTNNF